jgi:hypothetical protein
VIRESRVIFVVLEGRLRLCKMLGGAELTIEIVEDGEDLRLGVLISQQLGHGRELPA